MVERVALYWGSAPTVCDGTSRQPRVGVATRPPVTFRVVDAAAEADLDRHPLNSSSALVGPLTSYAAGTDGE